jgi:O-6-methylguanine DNA methyltransferase
MSDTLRWHVMHSPLGPLTLVRSDRGLCAIEFGDFAAVRDELAVWAKRWWPSAAFAPGNGDPLLEAASAELEAYFRGELRRFTVPLDLRGTPFQTEVWQALQRVPYGKTASYKEIAAAVGRPRAVRAVGGANNRNPVPIVVPCHRIVGADGSLVGYGGGLPIKARLLALEGVPSPIGPAGNAKIGTADPASKPRTHR